MRFLLVLMCLGSHFAAFTQGNLKILVRKEDDNTVFYARNDEYCPVSVEVDIQFTNFSISGFGNGVFVVPKGEYQYRLFVLTKKDKGKTSYSYTYKAVFGDVNQQNYDRYENYDLPYRQGLKVRIEQGYNGSFSHRNENSLDFNLPEGAEIRAARAGVVVAVEQQYHESCLREECKKMANHILVFHSDGSIGDYSHLEYQGARVSVGDEVAKGELIGLSGSTGYTRGPHLHFACFLAGFNQRRTFRTKFRINNGKELAYLAEGGSYRKNYP